VKRGVWASVGFVAYFIFDGIERDKSWERTWRSSCTYATALSREAASDVIHDLYVCRAFREREPQGEGEGGET
jgi:hypothetical protein